MPTNEKQNAFLDKHRAAIEAKSNEISADIVTKAKLIRDRIDTSNSEDVMRGVAEIQAVTLKGYQQMTDFLIDLMIREFVIEPMFEMLKGGFAPGGEYRKDH